jgi:hypothetical protein
LSHFPPGIVISAAAGGAAILTRQDGREIWFSLPLGTGAGLTTDEIALLLEMDNPYWRSKQLSLVQAGVTVLAAVGLGARFPRKGIDGPGRCRSWAPS